MTLDDASVQVPPSVSFSVFRYRQGDSSARVVLGPAHAVIPLPELAARAAEAIARNTFMYCTATSSQEAGQSEVCFVPRADRCDVLSIQMPHPRRHHAGHRRSLIEVLGDFAAAVACGKLTILDHDEVDAELRQGRFLGSVRIQDSSSLARVRAMAAAALEQTGLADVQRARTLLCVSEAATNALLHGGGQGVLTVRRAADRLRMIVIDGGHGLDFSHWLLPHGGQTRPTMGYGFKIMLEQLDAVGLHTGPRGTTLVLDRLTD